MLLLAPSIFCVCVALGAIKQLVKAYKDINVFPSTVPWAGVRKERFWKVKACLRELFAGLKTLQLGYEQYGKYGNMFVVPDPGFRPQVMIAQKDLAWWVEQPETIVSARGPQVGRFAINYLSPTLDHTHDGYMIEMIRKDFTRSIGKLQPEVFADLKEAADRHLYSQSGNWHEVSLWKTMEQIVFKSTLQMFVGYSLSRDDGFVRAVATFASCLGAGAIIVGQLMPPVIKPVVGYTMAIPVWFAQKWAFSYLMPEAKVRIDNLRRKRSDSNFKWEEPKDMMMWMVRTAMDRKDPKLNPFYIAERILFLMLGAIHTTIMTGTNMMLDLLSSPAENDYYAALRQEADSVFLTPSDWESHAHVMRLNLADSTLRETLRKNPVLTRSVLREVIAPDGLVFPDGQHLKKGTWVGIPSVGVHHDENIYARPQLYDPFRFVPKPKASTDEMGNPMGPQKPSRPEGLSTASDTYLAFGYGRHSCPGRWFVASQLKLLLAYLVKHYDFEPLESRPLSNVFGDSIVPSMKPKLWVRPRQREKEQAQPIRI